jgi:hypothetical protein
MISEMAAKKISKFIKLPIPKNHKIIDWKLHLQKAGRIGSLAKIRMYGNVGGDEKYRNKKWKEWWEKAGKYKKTSPGFQAIIKIKKPRKSMLLSEFVGIMLGDGGVNKYFTSITLSSKEKQYIVFISRMINKLFDVEPKVYKHKEAEAVNIVVNRKELVDFCNEIGLVKGNKIKQQIDIPPWIKNKQDFLKVCIRGLVDTDGCFYVNSYFSNNKKYKYLKIAFTSASVPLIDSVHHSLINFGINATIGRNHRDVRITEIKSVYKYIQFLGSNNKKHLDKIRKWGVALNGKAAVC